MECKIMKKLITLVLAAVMLAACSNAPKNTCNVECWLTVFATAIAPTTNNTAAAPTMAVSA